MLDGAAEIVRERDVACVVDEAVSIQPRSARATFQN